MRNVVIEKGNQGSKKYFARVLIPHEETNLLLIIECNHNEDAITRDKIDHKNEMRTNEAKRVSLKCLPEIKWARRIMKTKLQKKSSI